MNPVDVIGCTGTDLPEETLALLRHADLIAAPERMIRNLPEELHAETVILDGKLLEKLPILAERAKTGKTVVLASGDPLFCGIGSTLKRFVPPEDLRFHPAPTVFQQLFARLGEPWEKSRFISLHGKKSGIPCRSILKAPLCAVYGDAERNARKIAQKLIERFPDSANRRAAAGCNLGLPDETIIRGTLREIADSEKTAESLSVLVVLPDDLPLPELPLGLEDSDYIHHENMITHPEIRAVVLSKLRLAPGIMWDLGSGSGSVGLEAAGLCSGLTVHAVEKNDERFQHILQNTENEGFENFVPHHEDAMEALEHLPAPDRIFIGGGGGKLLEKAFEKLKVNGILVMTGITLETITQLELFQPEFRKELLTIQISRVRKSEKAGNLFTAENPIMIGVWKKEIRK